MLSTSLGEAGRTPSGVRGLKFWAVAFAIVAGSVSHPVRGAWIEIKNETILDEIKPVAPRQGCVD